MQNKNSLLHGKVGPALLRFALPFLAASLLQQLYSTVDMMAVGRLSATPAISLSAVSTGGQMTYAVTSLLIGLATGSTVLIGQYVGAGRREDVSRTIGTMFPLFTLIALGVSVVMAALTGPLVALLQVPAQAVGEAEQYLFICAVGMIFVTGYNMVSGILRGLGDSKSPMILVAIACAINIIGDIVLVGPLQLGAAGAALATVTAQGLSFLFSLVILRRRKDFPFDFKRSSFHLHRDQSKQLLKLGVPIAFQDFSIGVSFLFITAFINRIGLDESACVGVVCRVSCIAMLVSNAFMSAIAAMSAQNIGASQPKRARSAMLWGIALSFVFSSVLFVLIQLFPGQILSVFTTEAGVIEKGILYLRSNIIDALLVSFVFCMNGFFSGCGHTSFSMVNNLISTYGVRVLGTLVVSLIPGTNMFHIGLAAPAAS
ncbi:MAG: MATE family efflux transporter, partial [Oscillospiraceae bacterium]